MSNTELLTYIYWGGWVITFIVWMLITDRKEGLAEDVLASSLVALAWPSIILTVAISAATFFFLEWRDRK